MKTIVRGTDGESAVWWHWQDLRGEGEEDRAKRRAARQGFCTEGRAWLHVPGNCFQVSWRFGARRFALSATFSNRAFSDEAIVLRVGIPFIGLFYFLLDRAEWVKRLPGIGKGWQDGNREIGFSWYDGYLSISLWCRDGHDWSRGDRWWHRKQPILFNPANFFLGRAQYSDETLAEGITTIPMPEGEYPAKYRLFRSRWKRPRWPWAKTLLRANIEVERGIAIPGKGENDWDMDDDAIFSLTCPATTVTEAIQAYQASVARRRRKYGWHEAQTES